MTKEKVKRLPKGAAKGKPWRLRVASRLRGAWGYCSYYEKEIVISKAAEKEGIDRRIFLHEFFHKAMPWMAEEAIELLSTDTDDALEVAGY
jgi:hypothetical protein